MLKEHQGSLNTQVIFRAIFSIFFGAKKNLNLRKQNLERKQKMTDKLINYLHEITKHSFLYKILAGKNYQKMSYQ